MKHQLRLRQHAAAIERRPNSTIDAPHRQLHLCARRPPQAPRAGVRAALRAARVLRPLRQQPHRRRRRHARLHLHKCQNQLSGTKCNSVCKAWMEHFGSHDGHITHVCAQPMVALS
eukprot:7380125-Prymnesium_polylepis.1